MELVDRCKDKLSHFKVKELKDVLTELGLSKQGRKQDLVDRILDALSDEQVTELIAKKKGAGRDEVAKLAGDTYRKLPGSWAAGLRSKSPGSTVSASVKPKEKTVNSCQIYKTRCLCGSSLLTNSMIKCEDPRCNVKQHIACVVIPENPMENVSPSPPEIFYCETCRLSQADPFWTTVAHPLYPVKLNVTNIPADGSNPGLSIEKTFQLKRAEKDLLGKKDYELQAWCMLLNDKVAFRMQWPQYADLQVNDIPVRAINRPGSQLLGANGRDDGPVITHCIGDGINKISLAGCDARIFCVGIRIVKRRTLHQILKLIPNEAEGECFEDALTRVRKCIGGGATTENADSDSDIEVVADFVPVNLRCPMSGLRLKVAGRFKPCAHMGCFDLEVFVEMNQRSRKWQCPICLKNYSWETIIIDPYFNRIVYKMRNLEDDVGDIEVKPDGSWRVKAESDRRRGLGDLAQWHFPDGTLCDSSEVESNPKPEPKPEVCGDTHTALKLGIKKNQNGCWEFSKPNIIPMSSSSTGSGRVCEDAIVNQDGIEYESEFPPNGFNNPTTAAVIVLSDSEEDDDEDEIEEVIPCEAICKNDAPAPQNGIGDSYYENENPPLASGVRLYNPEDEDEFGSSMWSLPSGDQGIHDLPPFDPDAYISDHLVDIESNGNGGLVDNHLAFAAGNGTLDSSSGQVSANVGHGLNDQARRARPDSPSSFLDQDRSVKQRIYLPTDSDS